MDGIAATFDAANSPGVCSVIGGAGGVGITWLFKAAGVVLLCCFDAAYANTVPTGPEPVFAAPGAFGKRKGCVRGTLSAIPAKDMVGAAGDGLGEPASGRLPELSGGAVAAAANAIPVEPEPVFATPGAFGERKGCVRGALAAIPAKDEVGAAGDGLGEPLSGRLPGLNGGAASAGAFGEKKACVTGDVFETSAKDWVCAIGACPGEPASGKFPAANGGVNAVGENGGAVVPVINGDVPLPKFAGWKISVDGGMTPCVLGIKSAACAACAIHGAVNAPNPRFAPQIFCETLSDSDCDTLRLSVGTGVAGSRIDSFSSTSWEEVSATGGD